MNERVIVAALVKNEAHKYLASCLASWNDFADEIVLLDDGSTDDSAALAEEAGAVVVGRHSDAAAWGAEANARAALWAHAADRAAPGDWIFVLDADMLPLQSPKDLPLEGYDGVTFSLYDLWGRSLHTLWYREDERWTAHCVPRLWMVRRPPTTFAPEWSDRGIHCGHFPINLRLSRVLYAPQDYSLLHAAYLDARDREEKLQRYASVREQLSQQEWLHAASIGDEKPRLRRLTLERRWDLTRSS